MDETEGPDDTEGNEDGDREGGSMIIVLLKLKKKLDGTIDESELDTDLVMTFKVVGYFEFGMYDFDSKIVYIHQDNANDLLGMEWEESTEVEMAFDKPFKALEKSEELQQKYPEYNFIPWQKKHMSYFETVQKEKVMISFVLFFIMGGAAIGVAACLFSLVLQKVKEIGVLKATGVTPLSIVMIFLIQGSFIGITGSIIGFGAGLLALHFRNDIFKILWSDEYFLKEIPALIDYQEVSLILAGSIIICILGALLPAIFAASIKPTTALHSDN